MLVGELSDHCQTWGTIRNLKFPERHPGDHHPNFPIFLPSSSIMTELRRFRAQDLFAFNSINLDRLTETYNLSFYLSYMATWPDLFLVQHAPSCSKGSAIEKTANTVSLNGIPPSQDNRMMGYLMGKLEGRGTDWHSHVTAITVSVEYRRLGVARGMMDGFELSSDQYHHLHFNNTYNIDIKHTLLTYLYGLPITWPSKCMNSLGIVFTGV